MFEQPSACRRSCCIHNQEPRCLQLCSTCRSSQIGSPSATSYRASTRQNIMIDFAEWLLVCRLVPSSKQFHRHLQQEQNPVSTYRQLKTSFASSPLLQRHSDSLAAGRAKLTGFREQFANSSALQVELWLHFPIKPEKCIPAVQSLVVITFQVVSIFMDDHWAGIGLIISFEVKRLHKHCIWQPGLGWQLSVKQCEQTFAAWKSTNLCLQMLVEGRAAHAAMWRKIKQRPFNLIPTVR